MNFAPLILTLSLLTGYTGGFREGDWVNYENFRYITSVAMDQSVVYFGTTSGIIRYDRYDKEWLDPLTVTDGIPHQRIDRIAFDPATGRIWVNTPGGSAYYQPTFRDWYSDSDFPDELVRNDYRASDFPILTTEWGYTYQNGSIGDLDMRQFPLTAGVRDDFDLMFVGTWGMGPVLINTRYGDLNRLPFGPYNGEISVAIELDDEIWMGDTRLSQGGLTMYDRSGEEWKWYLPVYTDGLISSNLICAGQYDDNSGRSIWLGTEYGVVRYQPENDRFRAFADFAGLPSLNVLSLAADSTGVYVGTDNGLGFIPRETKKRNDDKEKSDDSLTNDNKADKISGFPLKSLIGYQINTLEILNDYLYIGLSNGVMRRKLTPNSEFQYVNTPDKMLSTEIFDIVSYGGSLYFATYRDIQVVDLSSEASSNITDQRYFDQWRIRKIAVDSANIWAATDMGLWKYRKSDSYSRLFNINDGMISDDVNSLFIDGDYIWLGTPRGLIKFYWNNPGRID